MGRSIQHPSEIGYMQLGDCGEYDISEMYYANSGVVYYMSLPKKYFFRMLLQLSTVNFIISSLCYKYWVPFLVPLFVIQFFKINIFVS